jgi:hypothetical protein
MGQARSRILVRLVLGLVVVVCLLCSCDSGAPANTQAGTATDNTAIYKAAIERYFNAYMQADVDTLLDSMDPDGPMYPAPDAIEQLRSTASGGAVPGTTEVTDISVIEESTDSARVQATVFVQADLDGTGTFTEETQEVIAELRLGDGTWRLYNAEIQ